LYVPLPLCAAFMLCHALAFLARDLNALVQGGEPGGTA
jgi:hypothetical protein